MIDGLPPDGAKGQWLGFDEHGCAYILRWSAGQVTGRPCWYVIGWSPKSVAGITAGEESVHNQLAPLAFVQYVTGEPHPRIVSHMPLPGSKFDEATA